MTTTRLARTQATKAITDATTIEPQSVSGLLYGLLIAALFWLTMAGLTLTLFYDPIPAHP